MNEPHVPRKRKPSDDTPRVTVFLDRALVDWVEELARREDRSRNYIIVRLLRQAHETEASYRKATLMTNREAEKIAEQRGIDLAHQCDEDAAECCCEAYDETENGKHAPGDTRCPEVLRHCACSHDSARLAS